MLKVKVIWRSKNNMAITGSRALGGVSPLLIALWSQISSCYYPHIFFKKTEDIVIISVCLSVHLSLFMLSPPKHLGRNSPNLVVMIEVWKQHNFRLCLLGIGQNVKFKKKELRAHFKTFFWNENLYYAIDIGVAWNMQQLFWLDSRFMLPVVGTNSLL